MPSSEINRSRLYLDLNQDIIEEALNYYRINVFARSFEIWGPADRTLIYCFLLVADILGRIRADMSFTQAQRTITQGLGGQSSLPMPGDVNFPLKGLFSNDVLPKGEETEVLRNYLNSLRAELTSRLLMRLYAQDQNKPSFLWMAFQKRKFMNKSL